MYEIIRKNWDKNKYLVISGFFAISLVLLTVIYKDDKNIVKESKIVNSSSKIDELKILKEFLLNQIKSPFINLNYEIKKGDTIQKILKKYKVRNIDIENVIVKYKKYGNPNQLLIGNKIDIIIKKDISTNKNSIIKFSVPITKSTTIAISRNEDNKIISQKIITKLYKRKTLAEIQLKIIFIHLL